MNLALMDNDREIIDTTAHVMDSAPESLIIGFPLICRMNVKICHDHIEAQYQGNSITINYRNNQVALDTPQPITIEPAQLLYLKVQQKLTEADVLVATDNKEHMPKIKASNEIGYTNTTNTDQIQGGAAYSYMRIVGTRDKTYVSLHKNLRF